MTSYLHQMIHAARDSARLHLLHGEVIEAERWLELAVRWEFRLLYGKTPGGSSQGKPS